MMKRVGRRGGGETEAFIDGAMGSSVLQRLLSTHRYEENRCQTNMPCYALKKQKPQLSQFPLVPSSCALHPEHPQPLFYLFSGSFLIPSFSSPVSGL